MSINIKAIKHTSHSLLLHTPMRIFLKSLFITLSVVTGATFLYSAWTKGGVFFYSEWTPVLPIQPFEYMFVEYLRFPWILAAISARFMVGLEAALGALIMLHFFGKGKSILKGAFVLVVIFSIYLVWLWATVGDDVNCGCFGDVIWMSPSASLVKNVVLLLVIGILIKFHHGLAVRWGQMATGLLLIGGISLPFFIVPLSQMEPNWLRKGSYEIELAPLYEPKRDDTTVAITYPAIPNADLRKGKHIIAFVSPSCEHCRIAVRKMRLMKKSNPELPFFIIVGGVASDLTDFWKETKAQDMPYMRLHRDPFLNYTGGMFPLILWIEDSRVVAKSTYNTLYQGEIEKWLKGGAKPE